MFFLNIAKPTLQPGKFSCQSSLNLSLVNRRNQIITDLHIIAFEVPYSYDNSILICGLLKEQAGFRVVLIPFGFQPVAEQ